MSKQHHRHCQHNTLVLADKIPDWIKHNSLFLGFASLFWLTLRTGSKPSRIVYPCQKTAAANVGIFLIPALAAIIYKFQNSIFTYFTRKRLLQLGIFISVLCLTYFISLAIVSHFTFLNSQSYLESNRNKPIGKVLAGGGMAATTFMAIPHAMAMPFPHRVVSVHDSNATSWFDDTSRYYGHDDCVNQNVVDAMFKSGMEALTGETTLQAAWEVILPDYQADEVVAIKVNFNDSIMGGGPNGYADADNYIDALAQIVNSTVSGLVSIGVDQDNIHVFDASRHITDRFRAMINYPNIRYYDHYGTGTNPETRLSTFTSTAPDAQINFSNPNYTRTHKISDVLVNADYLINMPIMKKHGYSNKITLSLKNHLGTIDGLYTGGHTMHSYFKPDNSKYIAHQNPIVDINLNTHIKDKTVLIIGDGLYAGRNSNNTPPKKWRTFDNDSPNMILFSADPIAIDSVMIDYLNREAPFSNNAYVDGVMIDAANEGLGVFEHWNNDTDRQYSGGTDGIDYIEIDFNIVAPPQPPTGLKLLK